ncbi:TIR domain-containing protein [Nocardioides pantholopis]|uniref:TIR domain-containing protein n=1 Tax=Nocardioides pantholopis TaxID=2483798 RepID=UPI000FD8B364|nr:TIR domain-containing protein [Nocardioides pantholopis]
MAKSVFFSFSYDRDAWRVQQVLKMGALEGQPLLNSQDWEAVKRRGDTAIEKWIDEQMAYKKAVVVLVGNDTADRRWVRYEIAKAWDAKKPLVGIKIHGLADSKGFTDRPGKDPFATVTLKGGGTVADYVTLHSPTGSNSQQVHNAISRNLTAWVDNAYQRR